MEPACAICSERFDERSRCPRVLPTCGHALCTECISRMIASHGATVVCPMDRRESKAPSAADLPKAWFILDQLDALVAHGPLDRDGDKCEFCDAAHAATSYCADCGQVGAWRWWLSLASARGVVLKTRHQADQAPLSPRVGLVRLPSAHARAGSCHCASSCRLPGREMCRSCAPTPGRSVPGPQGPSVPVL
jgi:hypothetical protein